MSSKKHLLNLALVGITLACSEKQAQAVAKLENAKKNVQCFGIQKCGGTGQCAISKAQVDEVKKTFQNTKYDTTSVHSCKGFNKCAAQSKDGNAPGFLEWVAMPSKDDCVKEGGFVFNADGKIEK